MSTQQNHSALPQEIEMIKAEGNALFGKGEYSKAIEKYDAAIEKVTDNAILFANRAACYIGLRKYIYFRFMQFLFHWN